MSCPTCSHTMHAMGCHETGRPFYWCPRCGTIRTCDGDTEHPALVDRCRTFEDARTSHMLLEGENAWRRLGIAEAIHTPDKRPVP